MEEETSFLKCGIDHGKRVLKGERARVEGKKKKAKRYVRRKKRRLTERSF